MGLGVKPSDFVESSGPSRHKGLNMSTKDETLVLYYFRKLEGLTQRLRKRVKSQGMTIHKLKRKLQTHYGSDFDNSDSDGLSDSDSDGLSDTEAGESDEEEESDIPLTDKVLVVFVFLNLRKKIISLLLIDVVL